MMSMMAFTVKREPLMGDNLIPSLSSALSDLPELSKFSSSNELSLSRNVLIVTTIQGPYQQNLPYISIIISTRHHVTPTAIIIPPLSSSTPPKETLPLLKWNACHESANFNLRPLQERPLAHCSKNVASPSFLWRSPTPSCWFMAPCSWRFQNKTKLFFLWLGVELTRV